jgi:hypothetical protein
MSSPLHARNDPDPSAFAAGASALDVHKAEVAGLERRGRDVLARTNLRELADLLRAFHGAIFVLQRYPGEFVAKEGQLDVDAIDVDAFEDAIGLLRRAAEAGPPEEPPHRIDADSRADLAA